MTAFCNAAILHGRQHTAALFTNMGTVLKPTASLIGSELRKTVCQFFLGNTCILFLFKRRESGRICNITAIQRIQRSLSGRMPSTSQLLADFSNFQLQIRIQRIQQRGFPSTGISRQGTDFSSQASTHCLQCIRLVITNRIHGNSSIGIQFLQGCSVL